MTEGFSPQRAESFNFHMSLSELGYNPTTMMELIEAKLNAESERILRMLPVAPKGYRWEGEAEYQESIKDGGIDFRLIYRLKEIR